MFLDSALRREKLTWASWPAPEEIQVARLWVAVVVAAVVVAEADAAGVVVEADAEADAEAAELEALNRSKSGLRFHSEPQLNKFMTLPGTRPNPGF